MGSPSTVAMIRFTTSVCPAAGPTRNPIIRTVASALGKPRPMAGRSGITAWGRFPEILLTAACERGIAPVARSRPCPGGPHVVTHPTTHPRRRNGLLARQDVALGRRARPVLVAGGGAQDGR